MGERGGDDVFEPAGVEIGRDLDQERPVRLGLVARGDYSRDEVVKRFAPLQVAQAGRVRRRDVDGQIVGDRGKGPDAEHIVRDPVDRVPVGADVDPDHPLAGRPPPEARFRPLEAVVVEAEAVDDRGVLVKAEQARPGIAVLRPRCERPDLDKAEAELEHRGRNFGVLVEPGGKAERIGKPHSQDLDRKPRIGGHRFRRRDDLQRANRRAMGRLRGETVENGSRDVGEPHASRFPKAWRPSGSSVSGRDQTTALISRAA